MKRPPNPSTRVNLNDGTARWGVTSPLSWKTTRDSTMLMTEMSVSAPETACILQDSRPHRHFTWLQRGMLLAEQEQGRCAGRYARAHQACVALRVLRPLLCVQPGTDAQLLRFMKCSRTGCCQDQYPCFRSQCTAHGHRVSWFCTSKRWGGNRGQHGQGSTKTRRQVSRLY